MKRIVLGTLIMGLLVLLPGCGWYKDKDKKADERKQKHEERKEKHRRKRNKAETRKSRNVTKTKKTSYTRKKPVRSQVEETPMMAESAMTEEEDYSGWNDRYMGTDEDVTQ